MRFISLFFYRTPLTTTAPQKHYRIVFIKAPTEPPVTLPAIPLQPPDEEKTLVYVLVKKREELPELVLPKPVSTTPSKPEVYFIRYKTQVNYFRLKPENKQISFLFCFCNYRRNKMTYRIRKNETKYRTNQ